MTEEESKYEHYREDCEFFRAVNDYRCCFNKDWDDRHCMRGIDCGHYKPKKDDN